MMKKKFAGLLFAVMFAVTAMAQKPSDFTGSLLWKITGNGLEKPSYVFGTYHLLGKELMDEVAGLKNAFETTEQIIGEVDTVGAGITQEKVMQFAMLPASESYKKLLSANEYARLDVQLKNKFGAGLEQMGMLKPSMLNLSLVMFIYTMINPEFNPVTLDAIDFYLQRTAKENGKTVIGLETLDEQLSILFNTDEMKTQMQGLLCALESFEFTKKQTEKMIADYRRGAIYQLYVDSFYDENNPCKQYNTTKARDAILKNRNDKWIEKIPALMAAKQSLIVVGAAHLAGEEGILYQLHKKGYTVEAVKQ